MPLFEPLQAGPYPATADTPDGPNQLKGIVDWAATRSVMRFATTAARDAAVTAPIEGMVAVTGTTTTMRTWQYRSAAWRDISVGLTTLYTPVLGPSASGYTATGRYTQIGGLVHYAFQITMATVSIGAGNITISLPLTAAAGSINTTGYARLYDSSTGNAILGARVAVVSPATVLGIQYTPTYAGALGSITNAAPWTWATGDLIDGFIIYEPA